jgi:hypothetical protein
MEEEKRRSEQARENANKRYKQMTSGSGSANGTAHGSSNGTAQSQSQSQSIKNSSSEPKTSSDVAGSGAQKPKTQPSTAGLRLAQLLKTEILRNKPDYRITPAKEWNWALTADRMVGLDGRDPEAIANLIRWVQKDEFWMTNILSMDKLREKFDALELKASGPRQKIAIVKSVSAVEQKRKLLEGAIQ